MASSVPTEFSGYRGSVKESPGQSGGEMTGKVVEATTGMATLTVVDPCFTSVEHPWKDIVLRAIKIARGKETLEYSPLVANSGELQKKHADIIKAAHNELKKINKAIKRLDELRKGDVTDARSFKSSLMGILVELIDNPDVIGFYERVFTKAECDSNQTLENMVKALLDVSLFRCKQLAHFLSLIITNTHELAHGQIPTEVVYWEMVNNFKSTMFSENHEFETPTVSPALLKNKHRLVEKINRAFFDAKQKQAALYASEMKLSVADRDLMKKTGVLDKETGIVSYKTAKLQPELWSAFPILNQPLITLSTVTAKLQTSYSFSESYALHIVFEQSGFKMVTPQGSIPDLHRQAESFIHKDLFITWVITQYSATALNALFEKMNVSHVVDVFSGYGMLESAMKAIGSPVNVLSLDNFSDMHELRKHVPEGGKNVFFHPYGSKGVINTDSLQYLTEHPDVITRETCLLVAFPSPILPTGTLRKILELWAGNDESGPVMMISDAVHRSSELYGGMFEAGSPFKRTESEEQLPEAVTRAIPHGKCELFTVRRRSDVNP
ncbi:hypothetical protein [Kistimonas asteriae]|uniref:hypothetical protein n=1 Tax=Kistimonas asteriae TaxID=517724 RepID=UPI001BA7A031|nr:hypothetical protein [Kistimonas asteriae]